LTLARGEIVAREGEVVAKPGRGALVRQARN
jgi:hypothetical protein